MPNYVLANIQQRYIDARKNRVRIPLMLMILDGWGIAPDWGGNAISLAKTPNFDLLWKTYPRTLLAASGGRVGLPDEAPGNSEAGHLNIGAGRIVHQDITVIDEQIAQGKLQNSQPFIAAINQINQHKSNVHIMGLLSETGTHSHIKHLESILTSLKEKGIKKAYIHLFSDGRDSEPMSGIELLDKVEQIIKKVGLGTITSIIGRYYAMDRDNHWGRTARSYNALVKCEGEKAESGRAIFAQSYAKRITDEFVEPRIVANAHQSCEPIVDNDVIISFNFRSDRIKQLIMSFTNKVLPEFPDRKVLNNVKVLSFTIYGTDNEKSEHIFSLNSVQNPLAKVISDSGLRQFHCAETEKYPHVTYFFNGGATKPFKMEDRLLVPSPKVKTYDLAPEMSAKTITSSLLKIINKSYYDMFVLNFANPDMVGHTGNLSATIAAVSYVDVCIGQIIKSIFSKNGSVIICADHGNAEQMVNTHTGDPDTEHTTNPVPFIIANYEMKNQIKLELNGSLSNIGPTILDIFGIQSPPEMSQQSSLILNN